VGGAKLADGLAQLLPPEQLTIVVNTGDDWEHLGLKISPDLDTVCYTLAGLANPITGWGQCDESWNMMHSLVALGGPDWFNLGDRDLATHLERTRRLAAGETLSAVISAFCERWGIRHRVLPMTDDPAATWVETQELGWLAFQEYFVRERCNPRVLSFAFRGAESARPAPGVEQAVDEADWVILCPSNPWVSIDPILRIGALAEKIAAKRVLAVSPIIGGQALKGPAAKMFAELGIEPSALAVARHYAARLGPKKSTIGNETVPDFVLIIDSVDFSYAEEIQKLGMHAVATNIVMPSVEDRRRLAGEVLEVCLEFMGEGR
jgi:LPPG:FO 2-phospho-L-lactate transferase